MLLVPETLKLPAPELPKPSDTRGQGLRSRFQGFTRSARESLCLLRGRSVRLILLSLVVLALANQEFLGIFIQYYSLRFHRSLVEAGYVLSIRGGVVVLIMGIVLPLLTKTLTPERSGLSAYRRDLLLARGSALLLCIGFLVLAGPDVGFVVAGLIIVTTGSGMGALCRSLITNLIKPDQTSMVFTLISILETLVSLPAGPLFAWAFSAGMNLRGFLYGLPFLILAALGLLAAIALLFLRGEMEDDELEWQPQEDDTSRVH